MERIPAIPPARGRLTLDASICVGVMWAVWHWPLFLLHGWSSSTPPVFLLILVGLSMVMALGFNASEESVVVAILMHSAFNASPRFVDGYLSNVATRQRPSPELLIAASFLLVGALLAVVTHGRLKRENGLKEITDWNFLTSVEP